MLVLTVITGQAGIRQAYAFNVESAFYKVALLPAYNDYAPDYFIEASTEGAQAQAEKFIADMGDNAIDFLGDDSLSMDQKRDRFRKLLNKNFDMYTIGRFVLGRNWKNASKAQQDEYQRLFKDLIVDIYSQRFNEYQGQEFDVKGVQDVGKKDLLVTSYIVPDVGSKVKVDWRVRDKGGQMKIIDIVVEGVSMTVTQRSEFASIIQNGGGDIEVLLDHLRK